MKYLFFLFIFTSFLLSNEFQNKYLTDEQRQFLKQHPIIKVSNEKDWAPYDYNENGKPKGYAIDYLNLLANKIGVKFVFVTDTWSNLIKKVENKEIDVIHPISENQKRKEFLNFSDTFIKNNVSIVVNDTNKDIRSLEDLKYKRVSVVKSWNTTNFLEKYYPEIIFKEYTSSKDKLEAVAYGEADATLDLYLTVNYLKQKYLLNNIQIVGQAKFDETISDLHFATRKDWPILRDILNIAMKNINDEELLSLNKKWIDIPHYDGSREITFNKQELSYLNKIDKIKMCIDPNWFPYEKIENGKHVGMSNDYFKIFQKIIPIPIKLVPTQTWTQTLDYAKDRKCDIISLAAKTPSREKFLNFTDTYIKLPLVIATKLEQPFIDGIKDILKYELAVVKGYSYIELLKNKYPKIKLVEVQSAEDGFAKVISGDVFGFIDTLSVVGYKIQKNYLGTIKISGKLEEGFEIGVATRNDVPELHTIFQKAVLTLTDENHRTILNKWVSVKFEESFDYETFWEIVTLLIILISFLIYRQYMLGKRNSILVETQNRLEGSVKEIEKLLDSTIEAIIISENGYIIDVNKASLKLFGYKNRSEIIGVDVFSVIDKQYHNMVKEKLKVEITEPYEAKAVKKDGTVFPVLVKGHNILLGNKNVRVSAIVDLTQLKHKEKLLTENTKMIALGEMLGNIAHQWRQPLSVITTAASGVKVQKEMNILSDEIFEDSMNGIISNANYLSNTIEDFRNFIKSEKVKKEFDLKKHLEKDLSILYSMLKINNINTILNLKEDIFICNIENELTQVIINIISNAKDKLEDESQELKYIFIDSFSEDNKAYITIKDNANGINEDIISKIFEPYFTTKHKKQGTGLGLYMTREILTKSMNGDISVKNVEFNYLDKKYKGAEFTISLDM